MEVWFSNTGTRGREADTRVEQRERTLRRRSSVARRESFCPLDKDLSWKSVFRNVAFRIRSYLDQGLATKSWRRR